MSRNEAIRVSVDQKESFVNVEVRSASQALSDHFSVLLNGKVASESAQEHLTGLNCEEVGAAITVVDVVSGTALHRLGKGLVEWGEGIAEVRVKNSAITIFVVPSHKEEDVVSVWVHAEFTQGFDNLGSGHPTFAELVDHLVGVHQVEVWLGRKTRLCLIDLEFETNILANGADKLLFLIKLQIRPTRCSSSDTLSVLSSFSLCANKVVAGSGVVRRLVNLVVSTVCLCCRVSHQVLSDSGAWLSRNPEFFAATWAHARSTE